MEYANTAFKTFGSWFVLILLYAVMFAGTVMLILGMIFLMGSLIAVSAPMISAAADPAMMTDPMMDPAFGIIASISVFLFILGTIVTIFASIFIYGFMMRVYRGGELALNNWGKMFVEGILALIILFIYMIPYTVVSTITMLGPMDNPAYLIIVAIIIPTILLIISMMVGMMGVIKFAKEESFGAAFHFNELFSIIARIGWLRYLGYMILISLIVSVAELVLLCNPFAGSVLLDAAMPYIVIVTARFFANLYDSAIPAAAE